MYKELLKLFRPFKKAQYFLTFLGVSQYFCLACVTFSIKFLIDFLQRNQFESFVRITVICFILMIIACFIVILNNYFWNKMTNESIVYLRGLVLKGIINKKPQYFVKNTTGSILSKIMNDVVIVAQSASIGAPMLQINISRVLIVMTALFYLNIPLTVAIIIFIPIYFTLFNLINKGIRTASRLERAKFSDINANVQETLSAIETVKIYQKEDYIQTQTSIIMREYLNSFKMLNRYKSIGSGLSSIFSMFLPIFIIFLGAYLAFRQEMSIGTLISYYAFLPFLTEPVNNLSDYYLGMQTTMGMSDRIMEYLHDDTECENKVKIPSIDSISFSNIGFRYDEEHDNILNNFSMELKSGDKVAILGKSGSGKSTILKLIINFLTPSEGQIKINGLDLSEIDKNSYYKRIALLQQFPFLFKDTVLNNITFGDEYSDEQIQSAIENANVSDLVKRLPGTLNYRIEEIGKNISGGEQQRICLARTLIRNADLLLLDEPTSALDENNERLLVDHLSDYVSNNNCIFVVVTHRKEILSVCNKAVYFKNGSIHVLDMNDDKQRSLLQTWIEEER